MHDAKMEIGEFSFINLQWIEERNTIRTNCLKVTEDQVEHDVYHLFIVSENLPIIFFCNVSTNHKIIIIIIIRLK